MGKKSGDNCCPYFRLLLFCCKLCHFTWYVLEAKAVWLFREVRDSWLSFGLIKFISCMIFCTVVLTAKVVIWVLVACQESIYKPIVQLIWYAILFFCPWFTHLPCYPTRFACDVMTNINMNICSVCLYFFICFCAIGKFWRASCQHGWRNYWG